MLATETMCRPNGT